VNNQFRNCVVVDLQDPTNPTELNRITDTNHIEGIVSGKFLFEIVNNGSGSDLKVYDFISPTLNLISTTQISATVRATRIFTNNQILIIVMANATYRYANISSSPTIQTVSITQSNPAVPTYNAVADLVFSGSSVFVAVNYTIPSGTTGPKFVFRASIIDPLNWVMQSWQYGETPNATAGVNWIGRIRGLIAIGTNQICLNYGNWDTNLISIHDFTQWDISTPSNPKWTLLNHTQDTSTQGNVNAVLLGSRLLYSTSNNVGTNLYSFDTYSDFNYPINASFSNLLMDNVIVQSKVQANEINARTAYIKSLHVVDDSAFDNPLLVDSELTVSGNLEVGGTITNNGLSLYPTSTFSRDFFSPHWTSVETVNITTTLVGNVCHFTLGFLVRQIQQNAGSSYAITMSNPISISFRPTSTQSFICRGVNANSPAICEMSILADGTMTITVAPNNAFSGVLTDQIGVWQTSVSYHV
jgi:hypothetical protein